MIYTVYRFAAALLTGASRSCTGRTQCPHESRSDAHFVAPVGLGAHRALVPTHRCRGPDVPLAWLSQGVPPEVSSGHCAPPPGLKRTAGRTDLPDAHPSNTRGLSVRVPEHPTPTMFSLLLAAVIATLPFAGRADPGVAKVTCRSGGFRNQVLCERPELALVNGRLFAAFFFIRQPRISERSRV